MRKLTIRASFWITRAWTAPLLALIGSVSAVDSPATLKSAFKDYFMVGVALNQRQFTEPGYEWRRAGEASAQLDLARKRTEVGQRSPAARPNGYSFEPADRYVEFGEKNGMFIVGHCLVWHSQTPRWVFEGDGTNALTRDVLLERMRNHIHTVVGRYERAGQILGCCQRSAQ